MRARLSVYLLGSLCLSLYKAEEQEFKLPPYIDTCYRDDPKVAECLKKEIEKLVPLFKSGSKDFELDPLDPMVFPNLVFNYRSSIVGGNLALKNAVVTGLTNFNMLTVKPKVNIPSKFTLDFTAVFPRVTVKSAYNLTGNVIRIPLNADGRFHVDLDYVNVAYHMYGNVKTINGSDYLIMKRFNWSLFGERIRSAYLRNDDVIDGKPGLNRLVVNVVRSSWKVLLDNMIPTVLKETEAHLKTMFTNFFKKYPYDIIFPKRTRTPHQL